MAMTNAERQKRYREKHKIKPGEKNRMPEKILFSPVRLAEILNVTDRQIRQLAQDGILEPEPKSRGNERTKYDIKKNVPLFIEYLKNKYKRKDFESAPRSLDDFNDDFFVDFEVDIAGLE
jgi:hypothetical protein